MSLVTSDFPARSTVSLRWSAITDPGRYRSNNEDAFLALAFDGHEIRYLGKTGEAALASSDFVFAVSDGMGGAKSGEFASRIAVDRIARLLPRAFRLSAAGLASGFADVLEELFEEIHHDLLKLGQSYEECAGMGATLTLGWFAPEWMYFAHIGDSRLYHLPHSGGIKQLTNDDTHVGWLRRKGQLNEREARTHPQRTSLQQALGAGNQFIEPHIGAIHLGPGDRFLICTDGVIDGLWDRRIEEIIRTAPQPNASVAQLLVREAVETSGRDNATAVVVEIPAVCRKSGITAPSMTRIFVYGTLKQHGANHRKLSSQTLVGDARTEPGYRLFLAGVDPAMVPLAGDRDGVSGEVWDVDDACLRELDRFEGVSEGLYRREPIKLLPPFSGQTIGAYIYAQSVEGGQAIGSTWPVG